MYKKIKNGSFMNWIWFIIATLPFVLLLIYALGFFNNEDLRANEQDNYTLKLNSISGSTLKEETNILDNYIDTSLSLSNYIKTENGRYSVNNNQAMKIFINNTTIQNWYFNETTNLYITINPEQSLRTEFTLKFNYRDTNNVNKATYVIFEQFNDKKIKTWNLREEITNKINSLPDYVSFENFNNIVISAYEQTNEISTFIFLNNNNLFLIDTWYNNYIQYVNDFNSIKYNSCPISYSYNGNTYNIEINNNNYLGTNETLEINQNFNYTLNEQPTLNYNNYFLSNYQEGQTTYTKLSNLPTEQQSYYYFPQDAYYQYYNNEYQPAPLYPEPLWPMVIDQMYIKQTSEPIKEYYNIESTIDTSLELIPNNNFNDFLTNVNNTIQTNGFVSNAFLNLSSLFGVNNVYYSLACYYIEYLLVIVLLHLAFDILYMLPNICHKFMEKIGGERD